ncbi:unnamed protein product [Phaedon cochleariae]|uniref:Uncharacterized protein n=1 Tax=Phaedon cochleariae TaxID=80249 RepID=A0A9N9X1U4_PHACE|nr:unnamed protein product [Phaedon cochleariae]
MKPQDSPASQLMAFILAENDAEKKANTQSSKIDKQDPVDAFLCGIEVTLKSFDPVLLNEAKGKIFGIVQELGLKQLNINARNKRTFFTPIPAYKPSSENSTTSTITTARDYVTHFDGY